MTVTSLALHKSILFGEMVITTKEMRQWEKGKWKNWEKVRAISITYNEFMRDEESYL